jgi:phosphate transport system permease protein
VSTTVPAPGTGSGQRHSAAGSSQAWRLTDRLGLAFAWFVGLLFCAICAAIVVYLAVQGIRFLHPSMLWTNPQVSNSQATSGGVLEPLIGTAIVVTVAMLIATPLGTAIAVWLVEYGRPAPLARLVESTIETLAGLPSIVLALFGLLLFESHALAFFSWTNSSGVVYGKSVLAPGVILALLALPYVVGTIREGLQAIPNHVREASYALGKTKIATIRRVLLPAARPSVITGTMLGAGHAIGDTAIIVFLMGDTETWGRYGHTPVLSILRGTGSTLTSFVFDNSPAGDLNQPQKAYAAAFLLLLIVLALNVVVDVFGRKSKEHRWS